MKRFVLALMLLALPLIAIADDVADKIGGVAKAPMAAKESKKNLLKPTNNPDSWQLEMTDGGKAEMKAEGEAIVFKTIDTDGTNWHVQAYQTGLDLKDGKDYVVKLKVKAPQVSELLFVGVINQDDWHEIGLHEDLSASDDFKPYEFEFTASDTAPANNRIGFILGVDKGSVSVKDFVLTEK